MKGLFINCKKAQDSIYESGFMAYQCLLLSTQYTLDYIEVDMDNREISTAYDFYFFNYHPYTLKWLSTREIRKKLPLSIAMVLEIAPNDPFVMCPERDFDLYCVLDPTLKSGRKNVYAFPRPLEEIGFDLPVVNNPLPVIGTFGFATKGKGFQHVVEAVNKEFDKAVVRINIPYGDFVPNSKEYAAFLGDLCKQKAKPGIEVQVTHEFMSKEDLIKWCAANTLNCFLYDRDMPGLAATTDQAIVSERPLSVSDNDTFRHITAYLGTYPGKGLKDSIEHSAELVKQIKQDWSPANFVKKFEAMLTDNLSLMRKKATHQENTILLSLKKNSIFDFIQSRYRKYLRKIKKISISRLFNRNDPKYSKKII